MKRFDIVNAELSGRKKNLDGTALDMSAMYETPDGEMMAVTKVGEHIVIGKLAGSNKTVVAEEPIIKDDTIEYRSLQKFNTAADAKDYAKTVETLSEEKSLKDIAADIDAALQKSKLRAGVYNLIGAREELKSRYTVSEIKGCLALTVICSSDSKYANTDYVDWAESYCQEHELDYINLRTENAPCKSHVNLINGFINRSISKNEIDSAVELNSSTEITDTLKV